MIIMQSRYGGWWLCINMLAEDFVENSYFDDFDGGDMDHIAWMEKEHDSPMGWGATPDEALAMHEVEVERFNKDIQGYRLRLRNA